MTTTRLAVGTLLLLLQPIFPLGPSASGRQANIRHNSCSVHPQLSCESSLMTSGNLSASEGRGGLDALGKGGKIYQPPADDFVPRGIEHAVVTSCMISGDKGPPPFAEAQVHVSYDGKQWDYRPIISRRYRSDGGVLRAIDDCRDWYAQVRKRIVAEVHTHE